MVSSFSESRVYASQEKRTRSWNVYCKPPAGGLDAEDKAAVLELPELFYTLSLKKKDVSCKGWEKVKQG